MWLCNKNSLFASENLLQTNGTVTGEPNSCSYADFAVSSLDQALMQQKQTAFLKILYFDRYKENCLVLSDDTDERLQGLHNFIDAPNPGLNFTMEIGNQSICCLELRISVVGNKLAIPFTVNQQTCMYIFTQIPAIKSNQLKVFRKVLLLNYVIFVVGIMIIQLSPKNTQVLGK